MKPPLIFFVLLFSNFLPVRLIMFPFSKRHYQILSAINCYCLKKKKRNIVIKVQTQLSPSSVFWTNLLKRQIKPQNRKETESKHCSEKSDYCWVSFKDLSFVKLEVGLKTTSDDILFEYILLRGFSFLIWVNRFVFFLS